MIIKIFILNNNIIIYCVNAKIKQLTCKNITYVKHFFRNDKKLIILLKNHSFLEDRISIALSVFCICINLNLYCFSV